MQIESKGRASRERQARFMESFHSRALHVAVSEMLYRYGHHWLTDEQMVEIVSQQVEDWRTTQKMNRRNRSLAATRAATKEES
jgi:hypothetical protein